MTTPPFRSIACIACAAILVLSPAGAAAEVITLTGILDSDITATVDYSFDDTTDTFSFVLTNTSSSGGFITNIGLDIGNLLELVSFTEDSPLNYSATNLAGSPPPPFGPSPTHPIDFGVFLPAGSGGVDVGETITFSWVMTLVGGGPIVGLGGEAIAQGLGVRFLGLSTQLGTDVAIYQVPEPGLAALAALAACGIAHRGRRRRMNQ